MVFVVAETYELRYDKYDREHKTYILGIYTSKKAAEQRLESERSREHNNKQSSASLTILEVDIDTDVDIEI